MTPSDPESPEKNQIGVSPLQIKLEPKKQTYCIPVLDATFGLKGTSLHCTGQRALMLPPIRRRV